MISPVRRDLPPIVRISIVALLPLHERLVAVTTFAIGALFKWMLPELPWALAFAFGAIVSPPDAISATAVLKRFAISSRLLTLLEGESLVNDASALILYKIAVGALISGTFSLWKGGIEFFHIVLGGIGIGVILGLLFQSFSKRYLEPVLGVVFSFLIPYVTYITAAWMALSGVLAVVTGGLIGSRFLVAHQSSLRRVLGYATWDTFIILMNCFVFTLIGLQLRALTNVLTKDQMISYTLYGIVITCAIVVIRMIWVFARAAVAYAKTRAGHQIFRHALILGWCGMRGIVSLAAALALPLVNATGIPIPGRNEVIFITFVVILLTLVIPGLTLPLLLRFLKIQIQPESDLGKIRNELNKIADDQLHHLRETERINEEEFAFLHSYFSVQNDIQRLSHANEEKLQNVESARLKVLHSQRTHLLEMWKRNEIDDKQLTHLEHELDMTEIHIARAELK